MHKAERVLNLGVSPHVRVTWERYLDLISKDYLRKLKCPYVCKTSFQNVSANHNYDEIQSYIHITYRSLVN